MSADINCANLKIFARLVKSGFTTEKQILSMGIGELIRIPKITALKFAVSTNFRKRSRQETPCLFSLRKQKQSKRIRRR